jgi:hypothetical protein
MVFSKVGGRRVLRDGVDLLARLGHAGEQRRPEALVLDLVERRQR